MSDEKRPYKKRQRAELEAETRLRITESAVALHGTRRPRAHDDERDRRARGRAPLDALPPLPRRGGGVRRVLGATGAPRTRPPTPTPWAAIADPDERLAPRSPSCTRSTGATSRCWRTSCATSTWCRSCGELLAASTGTSAAVARRAAGRPAGPRPRARAHARRDRPRAWRSRPGSSLVREQGLGDADAVELMLRAVAGAARSPYHRALDMPKNADEMLAAAAEQADELAAPGLSPQARAARSRSCPAWTRGSTCSRCSASTRGDAHIIRNAGGLVTDDAIRSLAASQRLLGTEEIVVVMHDGCGLCGASEDEFAELLSADGVLPTVAPRRVRRRRGHAPQQPRPAAPEPRAPRPRSHPRVRLRPRGRLAARGRPGA